MNARFWTWANGDWVKLTLRPGQSLEHATGGRTEEGWRWECDQWEHTGAGIRHSWCTAERDCDGRLDRDGQSFCLLTDLGAHEAFDGTAIPAWEYSEHGQRDYAAEAAGY